MQISQSIELLIKFEKMPGLQLDLTDKYIGALSGLQREIEEVARAYERDKKAPPLAWNLAPVAGQIAWARHLYSRIEEPMEAFKAKPHILKVSCGEMELK